MGTVKNLNSVRPAYVGVKAAVVRKGHFKIEGMVYFGPFESEIQAKRWQIEFQEVSHAVEKLPGTLTLSISILDIAIENDTSIHSSHETHEMTSSQAARILPYLVLREVHLSYEVIMELSSPEHLSIP